ncbi:hypothetical protein H9P43_009137 [Blastocladiella emersonii ATCC 22665]|nr:hypothetical protein H9P43_009137 [Blastocladiella emersonii ATCC 22665]
MPIADCAVVANDFQFVPGAKPADSDCCKWPGLYNGPLTGTIPDSIGTLNSLEVLYLTNNNLQGSIPASIGDLRKLEILVLSFNGLRGPLPSSLSNLVDLKRLELYSNEFSGELPILPQSITDCTLFNGEDKEGNKFSCYTATKRDGPCFAERNSPLMSLPTVCPVPAPAAAANDDAGFPLALIVVVGSVLAVLVLAIGGCFIRRGLRRSRDELDEKPARGSDSSSALSRAPVASTSIERSPADPRPAQLHTESATASLYLAAEPAPADLYLPVSSHDTRRGRVVESIIFLPGSPTPPPPFSSAGLPTATRKAGVSARPTV